MLFLFLHTLFDNIFFVLRIDDIHMIVTETGTVEENAAEALNLRTRIEEEIDMLRRKLAGHKEAVYKQSVANTSDFISYKNVPFFFSYAFSQCFLPMEYIDSNGNKVKDSPADFVRLKPRTKKYAFFEWVKFIINSSIGRYGRDPVLSFVLLNIKNRETAISSTKFGLSSLGHDASLNVGDLKDLLDNNPSKAITLGRQIIAMTGSITGSQAYWWSRKLDLEALTRFNFVHNNRLPIIFTTGSMAEYHWQELYRIFSIVFANRGDHKKTAAVLALSMGLACPPEHSSTVHSILKEELVIMNELFDLRTKAWFDLVLRVALDIDEYFRKYEFGESRGQLHFHADAYSDRAVAIHKHFNLCMLMFSKNFKLDIIESESNIAKNIQATITNSLVYLSAEHPAGRVRSNPDLACNTAWYSTRRNCARGTIRPDIQAKVVFGEDVDESLVGNIDKWPGHEGINNNKNDSSSLRKKTFQVAKLDEKEDAINHANRVSLHMCSGYCLKTNKTRAVKSKSVCRFHFGEENEKVKAHTDGKKVRKIAALEVINGVIHLELPRDHPRLVQGSPILTRGYGANYDMQVILGPQQDLDELSYVDNDGNVFKEPGDQNLRQESVLDWIARLPRILEKSDLSMEEFIDNLKFLFNERNYLDMEVFLETIIDYVVGYISKGEGSPKEAIDLFRKVTNSMSDDSEINSLAQKVNMAMLKKRSITRGESILLLQGINSYNCTSQFKKIRLGSTTRGIIEVPMDANKNDGNDGVIIAKNAWDNFLLLQKEAYSSSLCFDKYNTTTERVVPVYSNAFFKCSWPICEDYARTVLTLYKPGIKTDNDIIGVHGSCVEALNDFLINNREFVPRAVTKSIRRSYLRYLSATNNVDQKKTRNNKKDNREFNSIHRTMVGAVGTDDISDDRDLAEDMDTDYYLEDGVDADADVDNDDTVVRMATNGFIPEETLLLRHHYPSYDSMLSFTKNMATNYYGLLENVKFQLHENKKYLNPFLAINNVGQRIYLCCYFKFLRQYLVWNSENSIPNESMPTFYAHVAGRAGTGKSFVMAVLKNITDLVFGSNLSVQNLGPTGGSAANCNGGVVDRIRRINRNKATLVSRTNMESLNELANDQMKYQYIKVQQMDEISMWGKKLLGHTSYGCSELFNDGKFSDDCLGRIPASILYGDQKQLEPVLDDAVFKENSKQSTLKSLGKAFYKMHDQYFVLDKMQRQDEGDAAFVGLLSRVRNGNMETSDLDYMNSRNLLFLSNVEEKNSFQNVLNSKVLTLTCKNSDRDDINNNYLTYFDNVSYIKSNCTGNHAKRLKDPQIGMCKNIPISQRLSIG